MNRVPYLTALGLTFFLVSCQNKPYETFPVVGQVFFHKKPAWGALVTLVPLSNDAKAPRPTATVEKDGTFRLSTHLAFDGAPVGTYSVTIVYLSPDKKIDDQNAGPDLLRGRYGDARKTPLKVDIRAEKNELEPFLLK